MTQRVARRCIFCGGAGMSKEHFWPTWASQIVSNPQSKSYVSELHKSTGYPATPLHPPLQRKRNGDLSTLKLRVVCRACNNGWMSRAEQSAKPLLLALIAATQGKLEPNAQSAVAAWIAMKVIVAEHDQPATSFAWQKKYMGVKPSRTAQLIAAAKVRMSPPAIELPPRTWRQVPSARGVALAREGSTGATQAAR